MKLSFFAFLSAVAVVHGQDDKCQVPGTLTCMPISSDTSASVGRQIATPALDGDLAEWADVTGGIVTPMRNIFGKMYEEGDATYKCLYDEEKVYFALEIPGNYRFDALSDEKCGAIGTMMPIGEKATFLNMGGCPEAMENGCDGGIPPECSDYIVDLGGHWELSTTQMNTEYAMNATTGSGNDLIANNDDEYGVTPFCRPDDDDALAANEWSGAWSHSNPVEGEPGVYTFEMSRTLSTTSTATDAQMAPGNTYKFGIAWWDPFETEFGWTDAGHYLTGCSADWIKLTLAESVEITPVEDVVTCTAPDRLVCKSTDNVPTLDGDLDDWSAVEGGIVTEIRSIFGLTYDLGEATYKCVHDTEKVYFALEIPGQYRFNSTDDTQCAAIGTMMKIGSKAGFINMGGCPEAMETGCADGVIPPECEDYVVDLGAHWELSTTEMGVEYTMDATTGSGNDLVANNDDEFGVSPFCRPDDNDSAAGNEWSGSWSHSNPVDGGDGVYRFEISRPLTTASTMSDKQMEVGGTYEFGIAYWDPFETESGWTDAGHFLTGCSAEWIELVIEGPAGGSGSFARNLLGAFAASMIAAFAFLW